MMPKKLLYFYSLLSGVLLSLPWYPLFPGLILSVALLPLLFLDDFFYINRQYSSRSLFLYAALTFLVWNISTIWWLSKVTISGALFLISLNTLVYSFIFWLAHLIKRRTSMQLGRIALISFWITLEYASYSCELSLPGLNLGAAFGHNIKIIQWYEYTGVLGGSTWVLISNILLFSYFKGRPKFRIIRWELFILLGWLILPIIFSLKLYRQTEERSNPSAICILQPNIDPYTEKFNSLSQEQQLRILLNLADSAGNETTDYFIAPETAIDNKIWEHAPLNNFSLFQIREFLKKYPGASFITGAITYKEYYNGIQSITTRFNKDDSTYYDAFNSVIQVDTSFNTQFYHKSKFVIGVEKTPLFFIFRYLNKHLYNLGGITGDLGQDDNRNILYSADSSFKIAPLICYESVFGEYIHRNIRNGANIIMVLTNDGWWKGTPGYIQHFYHSRLRAIETRKWVVRSANTGISAIINTHGDIVQATDWWKRTAITGIAYSNTKQTFYVKNGDYIGRVAVFITICIVMIYIPTILRKRKSGHLP